MSKEEHLSEILEKLRADAIDDQIHCLEMMARQLEGLLAPLYEKQVKQTRILSDDERNAVLTALNAASADSLDTSDLIDVYMETQYLRRGLEDTIDRKLLETWMDDQLETWMDDPTGKVQESQLWQEKLSGNLAVIEVFVDWLKTKEQAH